MLDEVGDGLVGDPVDQVPDGPPMIRANAVSSMWSAGGVRQKTKPTSAQGRDAEQCEDYPTPASAVSREHPESDPGVLDVDEVEKPWHHDEVADDR